MSIDKRYNRSNGAAFNRNDFEAIDGQTIFELDYILTADSVVFVNGSVASVNSYTGIGTKFLTFLTGRNLYDKIMVIG